jgi:hypothetical protein
MTTSAASADLRPSYRAAGLTALGVLVLYVVTLAPTDGDVGRERVHHGGVHARHSASAGQSLFVLLGASASLLPFGGVAYRVNLLAAVCSALAAGIWFLVAERVLAQWIAVPWVRRVGSVLAACSAPRHSRCGTRASSTRRCTRSRSRSSPWSRG